MQKKTQLRLVAFVLFQGAFFAYGDCLYNADLILLLLIILASGRLAMIDVASGERLNVLIILVISLAVYAFVPWIPRLLEKKPSLLRRLGSSISGFRATKKNTLLWPWGIGRRTRQQWHCRAGLLYQVACRASGACSKTQSNLFPRRWRN
jgi:hypothetical protein